MRRLNLPAAAGLALIVAGAILALHAPYQATMFSNRPSIQFWVYRADPSVDRGYRLPNGTVIHGLGIANVKVELWDTVDIPPIVPSGEKRCYDYTDDWGLTFFQFAFEEQLNRTWHWRATLPDGTAHEGMIYLPAEGIDILILIEESRGLTYISPPELLRPLGSQPASPRAPPGSPRPFFSAEMLAGVACMAAGIVAFVVGWRK